ncbi:MAG TPA: hypothetical protein VFW60_01110 [Rhodanobacteraceae bacterium]|nr:hypothetical protein [Rhodanobacteraceae bacterium]
MEIILVQKAVVKSQATEFLAMDGGFNGRSGFAGAALADLAIYPIGAAFTDERKNHVARLKYRSQLPMLHDSPRHAARSRTRDASVSRAKPPSWDGGAETRGVANEGKFRADLVKNPEDYT